MMGGVSSSFAGAGGRDMVHGRQGWERVSEGEREGGREGRKRGSCNGGGGKTGRDGEDLFVVGSAL